MHGFLVSTRGMSSLTSSDNAVVSMDGTGKVVWAKNNEIQITTVRGLAGDWRTMMPSLMGRDYQLSP